MQSQTKEEIFTVLENYHQILLHKNMKAAPDKSHFFLTRVKFLGHIIERNTITPLKSRIDAIEKLQLPSKKRKPKDFSECLTSKVITYIKCNYTPVHSTTLLDNKSILNGQQNTENICPSTILDKELSIINLISNEKRYTDYFTKTLHFKPTFIISKSREEQQIFLTLFNFQHSQITQNEFEQLADLLLKYPKFYATSKFDIGKVNSPLQLPLKPDAVFKKQRASKVPIYLHDKIIRLLDIQD